MCLIAGDISPIDVITPLPVLCEDNDVPYIYVPSKVWLAGHAWPGGSWPWAAPGAASAGPTPPAASTPTTVCRSTATLCRPLPRPLDPPPTHPPSPQEELGAAGLTKRPTSCMLVLPKPVKGEAPKDDEAKEYAELFGEVSAELAMQRGWWAGRW